jgi:PAS domain S-box-containing protein
VLPDVVRRHSDRLARLRAEEALRKAHLELERRVEERTAALAEANERLKHEAAERQLAQDKLNHLNAVLRAIGNVNQLLAREKDRDTLLEQVCSNLIETRGYTTCWVALVDEGGKAETAAEAGLGEQFLPVVERLKSGEPTRCAREALEQPDVVVTGDPPSTCTDCPLAANYGDRAALTIRLEHGDRVYGLLSVSIPQDLATDEEEQHLLREVAGDMGFALHTMELEQDRRLAEEALRQSEARYRAMFEYNPIQTIVVDREGKIEAFNRAKAQSGDRLPWIGDVMFKDYAARQEIDMHAAMLECMQSGQTREFAELRYEDKFLSVTIAPFAMGAVITTVDITSRKRQEVWILKQNALLEGINTLFRETLACETEKEVARTFLAVAEQLTGSRYALIGEVNEHGRFDTVTLSPSGRKDFSASRSEGMRLLRDCEICGHWGRVITDNKPLLVNEPVSHPEEFGFPEGHPAITSFLGVPLHYADRTSGMIALANKESGYDLADQQAVENLSAAFTQVLSSKRIEEHIRKLSQELMKAQERERQRISCDLHDNLAQNLSSLRIGLDTLFDDQPDVPDEIRQRVSRLSTMAQQSITAIRDLAYDLSPAGLAQLGLVQTVRQYCMDLAAKSGLRIDLFSAGVEETMLDFATEIALYRLIQESLHNAQKHADASHVVVRLSTSFPHIVLRIEDNGKGFELEERLDAALRERRMGLRSMEQRVASLRGKMEIHSRPMEGTRILIRIPLHLEKT